MAVSDAEKWLLAIFSFNRPNYLLNMVRSLQYFSTELDVAVWDDRSTDSRSVGLLTSLRDEGLTVWTAQRGPEGLRYGGLHMGMNEVVERALGLGYTHLVVFQDDMQLVRPLQDVVGEIRRLFCELPDAVQITITFHRRLQGAPRAPISEHDCYRHDRLRITDTGVLHLGRFSGWNLAFAGSEIASSRLASAAGVKTYGVRDPAACFVPWPVNYKYGVVRGRERVPPRPLLVKPLGREQVAALGERPLEVEPYHEEWCVPWGWRALQPYGFVGSKYDWARAYASYVVKSRLRAMSPHLNGDMGRHTGKAALRD